MYAVILAGGFGTRLSEETTLKPKHIIWHIMNIYSHYGINDFIICCGYKGYMIKEYFANYHTHMSDMTVDIHSGDIKYHNSKVEPWEITLIDTELNSMTGGRFGSLNIDDKGMVKTFKEKPIGDGGWINGVFL